MARKSTGRITSKQNRHLIDRLRSLGLDQYVALPQIVAMGDTSSGKSSILSALSGITFPSSDKLTTRCATELILSNGPDFSGTVYLQRYNGKKEDPVTLTSPEMITSEIERMTKKLVEEGQHISNDAIIITARGPDYPDLTLTDLPGLIRTVSDGENRSIIRSVSELVQRYMDRPRTIILAVHPANVDLHNSEILESAQKADPEGVRTICVMTKLDLVDDGAEDNVIDILENKTIKVLQLGYHGVKCRGQKAINEKVTIEKAVNEEAKFFLSHSKWKNLNSDLLGIKNLGEKLVLLLESTIASALPIVIEEIESQIILCKKKIEKAGVAMDSDSSRREFFNKIIGNYLNLINSAFKGDYNCSFFDAPVDPKLDNRQGAIFYKMNQDFASEMSQITFDEVWIHPSFKETKINDVVEVYVGGKWIPTIVMDIDVENGNIKTRDCKNVIFFDDKKYKVCEHNMWRNKPVRDLSNLKKHISDNRGPELPIFPLYNVFCSIFRTYISEWNLVVDGYFMKNYESIVSLSDRAINATCPANISLFLKNLLNDIFRNLKESSKYSLDVSLQEELDPQTLNDYLNELLTEYRNSDMLDILKAMDPRDFSKEVVISIIKSQGVEITSSKDRQALEMFWALSAYIKVARERFTDRVPQTFRNSFIKEFEKRVTKKLRSISDKEIEHLLVESDAKIKHRQQLIKQLEALEKSKEVILVML